MEKIRTFIAIELDESIKDGLTKLQKRLKGEAPQGSVRWVRPEGIHLTLKFLGDVPADQIGEITRALQKSCQGFAPFSLSCGGLGCFPNLKRPRVVWVGIQEESESARGGFGIHRTGTLAQLQKAIEENVAPLGYPTEKRKFSPHLTLGRVQRRVSSGDQRRLGELVGASQIGTLGQMEVRSVNLMRSDLRPSGAVYTWLAEMELKEV
jgi:2'-5' RNA ligase